jgi:short-subunit dehydrogenase
MIIGTQRDVKKRSPGKRHRKRAAIALPVLATAAAIGGVALVKKARLAGSRKADFAHQVVVITGGSRGLGFAMAQEFARRGARLVICGRDGTSLQKAESHLRANGTNVISIPCDISSRSEAHALIERAMEHYGHIDVLVNNAGEIVVGPLESQTLDDFERAMNTLFWGTVYTTMAVLPQMKAERAGRIVNITSIGGKVAVPHLVPYACAKFAAVGFSEGLRAESARYGIKITTVVPGLMRTGSHINAMFKGNHRKEYGWFSMAATLPFSAMDAKRAARRIVDAAAQGKAEIILTPQARLLAWMHGIAPGLVTDALSLVDRLIPGTGSVNRESHLGRDSESLISRSFVPNVGRNAERDLNQLSKGDSADQTGGSLPARYSAATDEGPPPLLVD